MSFVIGTVHNVNWINEDEINVSCSVYVRDK